MSSIRYGMGLGINKKEGEFHNENVHNMFQVLDPSSPPARGCTVEYVRYLTLRYLVQQIPFRLLTLFLIVVDIALVVAGTVIEWDKEGCIEERSTSRAINAVDLAISFYFVMEIAIRERTKMTSA